MGSSRGWAALAAIGGGPGEWRRLAGAPREERDSGLRGPTRRVLRRGLGISPGTRPVRPEIDAPARRLRPLAWVASPSDPARFPSLDGASSRSLPVPRRASCQPRDDWTEALPRCRGQKPVSSAPRLWPGACLLGRGQGPSPLPRLWQRPVSFATAVAKSLSPRPRLWPGACLLCPGSGQDLSPLPWLWPGARFLCPGSGQGCVDPAPALAGQKHVSSVPALAKSMSPRARLWPRLVSSCPALAGGVSSRARLWPPNVVVSPERKNGQTGDYWERRKQLPPTFTY